MEGVMESVGRRAAERYTMPMDDPFLRDYFKITQSKAYRRLADKAQVMTSPGNPHVRTRAAHTAEVVAASSMIAEGLGLNVHLCMAIAAGHDLGHTPYGHVGERVLSEIAGRKFRHNVNSVVIAQHVEWRGYGLNLCHETLEGMLHHSTGPDGFKDLSELPAEFAAVMYADKIAYTCSDLNDAARYGFVDSVPTCALRLGYEQRQRTNKIIRALVRESREAGVVQLTSGPEFEHFQELKGFLFENVYRKIDDSLQKHILERIHSYFSTIWYIDDLDPVLLTSLLTDTEANRLGAALIEKGRLEKRDIDELSVSEIAGYLRGKQIDIFDPDLGWKDFAVRD